MLWKGRRESENVEDRRGVPRAGLAIGGGLGTIVILLIAVFLGVDPRGLLQQTGDEVVPRAGSARPASPAEEDLKHFVSVVLADTEDAWTQVFNQTGKQYRDPKLILFTDQVQ